MFSLSIVTAHAAGEADRGPAGQSTEATEQKQSKKVFGFLATMTGSGSLHAATDPDRAMSVVWTFAPNVVIDDVHKLSLAAGLVHDFRAYENVTTFTNGRLALTRKPISLAKGLNLSPRVSARLPFNDRSIRADSFMTGFTADGALALDLAEHNLIPLTITGKVSATRNLHLFSTSTTGISNSAWEMSEGLSLEFAIGSRVTLFGTGTVSHTWSYAGAPRSIFEFGEGVQVEVAQGLSVLVGHTNSGNTLRANGMDSNIALFDPNASSVYGSMSFSY